MARQRVSGHLLAWTTLTVALSASVGANVAQARPELGPRLTAAVAPAIVILASGLMERVSLSSARRWQQALARGGLVFVVITALVTSFLHQYHLLVRYGNDPLSAVLLPVAVDVLIVMASVCLTVIADQRRALRDQLAEQSEQPDIEPDMQPDTDGSDEQPQRGGKPLSPKQRAIRFYRADPSRSAASIGKTLREAGVEVSDRQVNRWLEPLRAPAENTEPAELVTAGV